jgi:hypothetical protein
MTREESGRRTGRKYGATNGRRAVESGQLAKAVSPEVCAANGRIQGKRNAESGHMRRIQEIGASLGGKAMSNWLVESGHIFRITTPETRRKGGVTQCHIRWHVARNKPNPKKCELCRRDLENANKLSAANEPPATQSQGSGKQ